MKKILLVILMFVLASSLLFAGGKKEQKKEPETAAKVEPEEERLYVWNCLLSEIPYFIDHRVGLEIGGLSFGVDTKYTGPTAYDVPAMIDSIEQLIGEDPTGLLIVGIAPELAPVIDKAMDRNIPVVTLDADVITSKRLTFIGTSNYNAGVEGAKIMAEAIGGKGKIAIVSIIGQTNLEERVQGWKDHMAKNYPGIEIVQVIDDQGDELKGAAGVKAFLQSHPDAVGVASVDATGAKGAAVAVEELGMQDQITIIGMDRDDGTLKAIEDGIIYASVAQQSALMPYWGMIVLESYLKKNVDITRDDEAAGIPAVPNYIDTGTVIITKENANQFYHAANPFDYSGFNFTPNKPDETYVWVSLLSEIPYFIDHRIGLEAAGEELGVKTKFVGPTTYDVPGTIDTIEQLIGEKPDGLLVIGVVEEFAPVINKALDNGIPVVTLDADVTTSNRLSFIGTSNYNAGVEGAKIMAEAIGGKGKIAIVSIIGQTNLEERVQGWKDHMAKNYPGIEIVQVIDDQGDELKGAAGVKAFLQSHPDAVGVASVDATGAKGAAVAVEELGMQDQITIIGMDRDDGTLKAIEDGLIYASVAQQSALMSYYGTKLLYYLNHGPVPITQNDRAAGIRAVPAYIDTGTVQITKENAKYFYHE